MEIKDNDVSSNTTTRDNTEKFVLYIDPTGDWTRYLREDDTMKPGVQATR